MHEWIFVSIIRVIGAVFEWLWSLIGGLIDVLANEVVGDAIMRGLKGLCRLVARPFRFLLSWVRSMHRRPV